MRQICLDDISAYAGTASSDCTAGELPGWYHTIFAPNPSGAVLIRDVMVNAAFFIILSVFL